MSFLYLPSNSDVQSSTRWFTGSKISRYQNEPEINSFNILENYFKYAKSVFIGKSLLKELKSDSGQNPIDAVKLRCQVYHGPYVYNFEEIYEILKKNNIARKIEAIEDLSSNLIKDLESPLKKETTAVQLSFFHSR